MKYLKNNELADNLPRGVADIKSIEFSVDGSSAGKRDVSVVDAGPPTFWRQHPYKGTFKDIKIVIPLEEGTHVIRAQTTENAAELTGFDEVSITISKEVKTSGGAGGSGTSVVNIYMPQAITDTSVDTVQYYLGKRDPLPKDPFFSELPDEAASSVFHGNLDGIDAIVTITKFTGLTDKKDTLTAELSYIVDGEARKIFAADFTETKKDSNIFRTEIDWQTVAFTTTTTKWNVDKIINGKGSNSSYLPSLVRIKGYSKADELNIKLDDEYSFDLEEKDGWFYLKGGSTNLVFNIYSDGKLVRIFYDEKGRQVGKSETKDFIQRYKLIRKDFPDFPSMGQIVSNVVMIGLDGDYNRDGNPADDKKKFMPVNFLDDKGMVALVNCDDDSGDKAPDYKNEVIDGANDKLDMSPLNIYIRNLDFVKKHKAVFNNIEVELSVISPETDKLLQNVVRIFLQPDDLTKNGVFTTKESKGSKWLTNLIANDKLLMLCEGMDFSQEFIIRAEWRVKAVGKIPGYSLGSDEVRGITSPFLVLSNCADAKLLHASENTEEFKASLNTAMAGIIPVNWEGRGFIQDSGEFGYTCNGAKTGYRAIAISWGGDYFNYLEGIMDGYGHYDKGGIGRCGDIEATPAFGKFKYGRVFIGNKYPQDTVQPAFFNRQKVQKAVKLEVEWLAVGHVDEVFSIVPSSNERGFTVLVADLDLAIDLLEKNPDAVTKGGPSRVELLKSYKDNPRSVKKIQNKLKAIREDISKALEIPENEFIKVPVCFDPTQTNYNRTYYYLPNMVNMTVVKNDKGRRLAIPDPLFAPHYNDIVDKLKNIGYQDSELKQVKTFEFIKEGGGSHCATNSEKEAPKK